MTKNIIRDPRKQHKMGKIPPQVQPEPGLAAKLQPRADHGEDAYVGHGRLRGRRALVTGGDSGIGRAVVLAFAKEGADVVFTHLPSENTDADDVMSAAQGREGKVQAVAGDLTNEQFARSLPHRVGELLGGLDLLVNNAGKQVYQEDITKLPTGQLVDTFTVNVFAVVWIIQEALQFLPAGSSIINTTSIQATQPSPGLIDYAATKAAILNLTRGLSEQLTPKGIRVNAVAPGPIWTPLQPSHGQPEEKLLKFGDDTPLGRPGQPVELAGAYVFLASDEASYISGEVIGVTGGKLR